MHAAVLMAAINPYHPPKSSDAPLDTLLVTIGLVIIILLICVPAHLARARELRQLAAQQPPLGAEPEATAAAPH
jgi:hypothetical protein